MKQILQYILKIFSILILRKYHPQIIGITGSVGKTSTKEAVLAVLKSRFNARGNISNYNNEIGLPLTIINARAQGKSLVGWVSVFWQAILMLIMRQSYPEILVLEMGVDRPGDMDYFNQFIHCDIGILTSIGSAHIEFFGSVNNIKNEKAKLLKNINPTGRALINYDNAESRAIINEVKATVLSFGFDDSSDIKAKNIQYFNTDFSNTPEKNGLKFEVVHYEKKVEIILPGIISRSAIYSSLAAIGVGLIFNMSFAEIINSLKNVKLPKGRMNLIKGINGSLLIDDTYNASPQSVKSAIDDLDKLLVTGRKIIVLGDMLELGVEAENEHEEIGKIIASQNIDKVIVLGEFAQNYKKGLIDSGYKSDDFLEVNTHEEAGKFLQDYIQANDIILFKGSQGVRIEKVVKLLMAEPDRAKELLVRQDEEWGNK